MCEFPTVLSCLNNQSLCPGVFESGSGPFGSLFQLWLTITQSNCRFRPCLIAKSDSTLNCASEYIQLVLVKMVRMFYYSVLIKRSEPAAWWFHIQQWALWVPISTFTLFKKSQIIDSDHIWWQNRSIDRILNSNKYKWCWENGAWFLLFFPVKKIRACGLLFFGSSNGPCGSLFQRWPSLVQSNHKLSERLMKKSDLLSNFAPKYIPFVWDSMRIVFFT